MYPLNSYELAQARVVDGRRQPQRDALTRATRQAGHARTHRPGPRVPAHPATVRRLLAAALDARASA